MRSAFCALDEETHKRLANTTIGFAIVLLIIVILKCRSTDSNYSIWRSIIVNTIALVVVVCAGLNIHDEDMRNLLCWFLLFRVLTFVGDRAFVTRHGFIKAITESPQYAFRDALAHIHSTMFIRYGITVVIEFCLILTLQRNITKRFVPNIKTRSLVECIPGGTLGLVNKIIQLFVIFALMMHLRAYYVYSNTRGRSRDAIVIACALASVLFLVGFGAGLNTTTTRITLSVLLFLIFMRAITPDIQTGSANNGKIILGAIIVSIAVLPTIHRSRIIDTLTVCGFVVGGLFLI